MIVHKIKATAVTNLKYLYNEKQEKRRGSLRKFDGKVSITQIDKGRIRLEHENKHVKVYSGIVRSAALKRKVKLAYIERWEDGKYTGQFVVLFSTDLNQHASMIYQYYKSRFQIELLYRDAKQHCGLTHCQARDEKKLHRAANRFHFNASLTTVSLSKAIYYLSIEKEHRTSFSMEDIKTAYANKIITQ